MTGDNIVGLNDIVLTYNNSVNFVSASIPPASYSIGQSFGGGIIFYIDGTGQHGLISAPSDQSTGIQWYNGTNITTGASGTAVGTGKANTTE